MKEQEAQNRRKMSIRMNKMRRRREREEAEG
jgi:hypothetical protein